LSNGLSITGFGFQELQDKLDGMGDEIQKEAGILILDGAQRAAAIAKELAPVDFGFLKNMIYAQQEGAFGASLNANAEYSAYQEWGTGESVNIAIDPVEREYESTFQTGKQTKGHFAHPYFFPALYEVLPSIISDVETMIQEVADK